MTEDDKRRLAEIEARHERDEAWRDGPSMIVPQAHDDRGWLLDQIDQLIAALKASEAKCAAATELAAAALAREARLREALTEAIDEAHEDSDTRKWRAALKETQP